MHSPEFVILNRRVTSHRCQERCGERPPLVMLNEVKHLACEWDVGIESESGNPSQARSFAVAQDDKRVYVASLATLAAPRPSDSGAVLSPEAVSQLMFWPILVRRPFDSDLKMRIDQPIPEL